MKHNCTCTPTQIQRYTSRLSGPLLDRIDLHLQVPAVSYKEMTAAATGESSAVVKERVEQARAVQKKRYARRKNFYCNGQMTPRDLKKFCPLDQASAKLIEDAVERLGLSARSFHRILKISRTIADLDHSDSLLPSHVAEAIQYRRLDCSSRF